MMMFIFNIANAIKTMSSKKLNDLVFLNYCKQIRCSKENNYYLMKHQKKKDLLLCATKLIEKALDAANAKEYYQLFSKIKNKKLVKLSKMITQ